MSTASKLPATSVLAGMVQDWRFVVAMVLETDTGVKLVQPTTAAAEGVHPTVVAPPSASVQRGALVPVTVPEVRSLVSVPCKAEPVGVPAITGELYVAPPLTVPVIVGEVSVLLLNVCVPVSETRQSQNVVKALKQGMSER